MSNIDEIIEKALYIGGFKTKKNLAKWLEIDASAINQWKRAGNIPKNHLNKIEKIITDHKSKSTDECIKKETTDSRIVEIPYFEETYGSMGVGGLSYDAQPTVMSFDSSFLKSVFGISNFKNLHIINAVGDSMAPTITSGELLLVNPFENENHTIKDQGVYVILSPQGILVKRIKIHPIKKEWKLVSDNPNEEDLPLQEDEINHCTVIGRVVGHFDRI